MKKLLLITLGFLFSMVFVQAQNETMYIMKSGNIVGQYETADVDSIIFYEPIGTFTDSRDGNVYRTVTIGNQVWMAENLKYLPEVFNSSYSGESIPYYYVYNYDGTDVTAAKATANYNTYGVLYNWKAAMGSGTGNADGNPSGMQGVCPTGWHLPSDAEWIELRDFAAGVSHLMEAGDSHWSYDVGDNSTGFTALPGGMRNQANGSFSSIRDDGYWWTTSSATAGYGAAININYQTSSNISIDREKEYGHSVRCVKN